MTLNIQNARRKTFDVTYVEVTADNMEEVASWSGGKLKTEEKPPYIQLSDKNALNSRQNKAFVGDLVVYHDELNSYKSFGQKAFERSFEEGVTVVTHHSVARDAGSGEFVSPAYAAENPDTTVNEDVTIKHQGVAFDPDKTQLDLPHDADPS